MYALLNERTMQSAMYTDEDAKTRQHQGKPVLLEPARRAMPMTPIRNQQFE